MWVKRVFANHGTFKEVDFENGYNVVLADITSESTEKDSRNGLGKSMLVEIINYCLGSGLSENLKKDELQKWSFGIEVNINGRFYSFERSVVKGTFITIRGDLKDWPVDDSDSDVATIKVEDFSASMGMRLFGLELQKEKGKKTVLSYRNLLSYFMRSDATAFTNPFKHFANQSAASTQICNAYLLGLNWELAAKVQEIKSKIDVLDSLQKASTNGLLAEFAGSTGELEAERVRLAEKLRTMEKELEAFHVHEQYYDIQKEADGLTQKIHALVNTVTIQEQTIKQYRESLEQERDVPAKEIKDIYFEAGIHFSGALQKQLDEVQAFHKAVVKNRKIYLEEEIKRLSRLVQDARKQIGELSEKKQSVMRVLKSHGALEEYSRLQDRAGSLRQKLEDVTTKIRRLYEIAESLSRLKVELEENLQILRQDYLERQSLIDDARRIFNANSEFLYSEPGTLSMDVGTSGYRLRVGIKRAGSGGVDNMKVFCYDLLLAELWSTHHRRPLPLIHDSRIFDGVDERQVAKALELAYSKATECGFQYICTINSDNVPYDLMEDKFKKVFEDSIKVRYNDKDEGGTLLGFRF